MGSPAEQAALQYAVDMFFSFGLDEAYILPFRAASDEGTAGINTQSGTAVGVLKGTTDRIIVIGAHIDSESPEIPGANDNASGSSVVLELARVMRDRNWESTFVFCLFGGEEAGKKGSYHFVDTYADIDKVVLMLQVDMANNTEWLIPEFDLNTHSAPEWLVEASYEEFNNLGYSGLSYPTHFITLNAAVGGGSSDHEPFLRAGIPAIDFTTDITEPIHTQQDSYEFFRLGALERSGDLVYRLAERFDGGVPEEKSGRYLTVQFGTKVYFLPFWVLWVFIAGSIVLSARTLTKSRTGRSEKRGEGWPRVPGLKLLSLTFVVALLVMLSEDVLSILSGYRSPWYANPSSMIPLGIMVGALAFLIIARYSGKLSLSRDLYRYALRSHVTLFAYLLLASLVSPRLAMYPALGLFFTSLAFISRRGMLSVALVILGAYPTSRLLIPEIYDFMARALATVSLGVGDYVITILFALEGTLVAVPFVLAFVAVVRSKEKTWPSFPVSYRSPVVFVTAAAGCVLFSALVLSKPAYTEYWRQKIVITQEYSSGSGRLRTSVESREYLDGARIQFGELDTTISGHALDVQLPELPFSGDSWLSSEVRTAEDSAGILLTVKTWIRPYMLEIRYATKNRSSDAAIVKASAGQTAITVRDGGASISYSSFPDTLLLVPVMLSLNRPDTVEQTIVATYVEPAFPVIVEKEHSSVVHRTIVRESKQFYAARTSATVLIRD
jgi:hypothetical protein